jgi:hypothetical protein
MNAFHKLGLEDHLVQAVTDLGFETPSEVQEKTIPLLLEENIDLVALAQTGTGKTAAFGFPMLQKIDINSRTTQGLILSPTRELCLQITNEMKLYGKHCKGLNVTAIYGGASITDQAKQVKRGAQIIVATPGRMKDMISRRLVDISKIEYGEGSFDKGFYFEMPLSIFNSDANKGVTKFTVQPLTRDGGAKLKTNNPLIYSIISGSSNDYNFYLKTAENALKLGNNYQANNPIDKAIDLLM